MKINLNIRKIARWLATFFIAWLGKKILDATGIFENVTVFLSKMYTKNEVIGYLNKEYPIWKILFGATLLLIGYWLTSLIFRLLFGKQNKYNKKREQLKKWNKQEMGGILWKWDVEFDDSGRPFISNLQPYCISHGEPPLKMSLGGFLGAAGDYVCPIPGCRSGVSLNSYQLNSIQKARQYIESHLESTWEKINK
ncbi:MAG TPA: hypothetical protein VK783_12425 [Bacteroidia bacterium]|jgi:hypothetical protein|nr:hypothetical protein [Bacteroidia bacterium]